MLLFNIPLLLVVTSCNVFGATKSMDAIRRSPGLAKPITGWLAATRVAVVPCTSHTRHP